MPVEIIDGGTIAGLKRIAEELVDPRPGDRSATNRAAVSLSMVVEALARDRTSTANVISAETTRSRFQFDSAKAALAAVADLRQIQQSAGSEREKIERAVTRLFGPKPTA